MSGLNVLETDGYKRNATKDATYLISCDCDGLLDAFSLLKKKSKGIIDDARDGEPYEVLIRRIQSLHDNLVYCENHARKVRSKRAKFARSQYRFGMLVQVNGEQA